MLEEDITYSQVVVSQEPHQTENIEETPVDHETTKYQSSAQSTSINNNAQRKEQSHLEPEINNNCQSTIDEIDRISSTIVETSTADPAGASALKQDHNNEKQSTEENEREGYATGRPS